MFSSNTPVQNCRKSFRAFTNQLVDRNNTHNQQHQQDRQPPSEEFINTNGQQPQATVSNNGIGGQLEDQQLPSASLILGHRSRINPRLPRPSNLPTVPLSYAYVRAQLKLFDYLAISKLFASVGSSMGGMQSIVTAWLKPQRAQRMTLEERLAQGLSTGGTSEVPGQTVGLDNGCKQSPETDRYGCDSIQQTLLSQEDQKDEDPVK
ncbi:hypothetical protein BY996DRAFT_6413360 [Phakopsora pachyrhizi]|nr:hypothetical protein BY996DRAFT_6413360 [Phakopsora pachyrhizi]